MKRMIFISIFLFLMVMSGCSAISRDSRVVIEFPSVVEDITRRTDVPVYNNSSYYTQIYIRGEKVAEMPPGGSFRTQAHIPFRGMEVPVAALMYNAAGEYVGCYTDVLHLHEYRTSDIQISDRYIKFVDDGERLSGARYKSTGRSVRSLPIPRLKHTLGIQVVYNSNHPGVLRINGDQVKRFPGRGGDRIYYKEWNLMNYRQYGNLYIDIKYYRGNTVVGYSRKKSVYFRVSRPEAYCYAFGPEIYK